MNQYRVTVSFGDGNPKTTDIEAKSGYEAHLKAKELFVNARGIHVLGLVSLLEEEKKQPVATKSKDPSLVYGSTLSFLRQIRKARIIPIRLENNEINPIVLEAVRLRKEGMPQAQIAKALGISRGTVRRFINANLDQPHNS